MEYRLEKADRAQLRGLMEPSRILFVVVPNYTGVNILPICFHNWCGFEPPLYMVAIHNMNYSYELMRMADEFVLAIPGESMAGLVEYFGTTSGRDYDKVKQSGVALIDSCAVKVPSMAGALANIECRTFERFQTGDHLCAVGEVKYITLRQPQDEERPLLTIVSANKGYDIVRRFKKHVVAASRRS